MLKHISTTWALVQNIWSFDATDIWWNLIFGEIWLLGSAFGIWWHFLFDGICCFTALYILRYCIFDGLSYIWTYLVHICNTPNSLGCNSQASTCCSNFQSCLKQSISDSILPVAGPNIPISGCHNRISDPRYLHYPIMNRPKAFQQKQVLETNQL